MDQVTRELTPKLVQLEKMLSDEADRSRSLFRDTMGLLDFKVRMKKVIQEYDNSYGDPLVLPVMEVLSKLEDVEKGLKETARDIRNTLLRNDNLTMDQSIRSRVRIGAVHRVTLKEFPIGTYMYKQLLLDRSKKVAGVTLTVR
jgi:hypothetical protein